MSDFYAVGKSVARVDAVTKVTGAAGYTADVMLPGMLYGKAKRSPHPHAWIARIDTSRADPDRFEGAGRAAPGQAGGAFCRREGRGRGRGG
ncbi:MAG: hypothetical protein HYV05_10755 [Deltaproteobacteria bacterium]|nr:hypothetical protein [Deltaproteobacteria bacterium]